MKRFTETNKWRDPWFRRLSPTAKHLWNYLTENCDCTGLIDLDFEAAIFDIGCNITEEHLTELGDRVQRTVEGKIFIPRFIPFQYGSLSDSCPAHKTILKLITERNISRNGKGYQYPTATLPLGYDYPTGKDKDKEKSTEGEVQEGVAKPDLTPSPQDIYNAYPRKEAMPKAVIAILSAIKRGHGAAYLLERTIAYSKTQPPYSRFTPKPAAWYDGDCFNDNPAEWTRVNDSGQKPKDPNQQRLDEEYQRHRQRMAQRKEP